MALRAWRLVLTVLIALLLIAPAVGQQSVAERAWFEGQNWWRPTGSSSPQRLQIGSYVPVSAVTGVLHLDVRVETSHRPGFHAPGHVQFLTAQLADGPRALLSLDWIPTKDVETRSFPITFDVRNMPDGWHNLTLQILVAEGTARRVARLVVPVRTQNGPLGPSGRIPPMPEPVRSEAWVEFGDLNDHERAERLEVSTGVDAERIRFGEAVGPVWEPEWSIETGRTDGSATLFLSFDPFSTGGDLGRVQLNEWPVADGSVSVPVYPNAGPQRVFTRVTNHRASRGSLGAALVFDIKGSTGSDHTAPFSSPGHAPLDRRRPVWGQRGDSALRPGKNQAPTAVIDVTAADYLDVSFTAVGSSDADSNPLTYSWAFGDGHTSTDPEPTHSYVRPGVYVVELAVSDGAATDTATHSVALPAPPWPAAPERDSDAGIPKWRRTVLSFLNHSYTGNPFLLEISARFVHRASGTSLTMPGYYDGDDTWRVAFMPTLVGSWTWVTRSTDADLDGQTGRLTAVESGHPGALRGDIDHPNKWRYADGPFVVPIGVFASAMLDDASPAEFVAMAGHLRRHRMQLLNFRLSENDRAFADVDRLRMNLGLWQRLEKRMETLTDYGLGVDVMLYADDSGQPSFDAFSVAERLLIRSTVARLAAFPVVMFNSGIDLHEYRDQDWVNWYGTRVRSLDPYDHPVSSRDLGDGGGGLVMEGKTYNSVGDRNSTMAGLVAAYNPGDGVPASNNDNWSEDLTGDVNGHTRADIRRAAWKSVIAGGVAFHVRDRVKRCPSAITECDRYFPIADLPSRLDAAPWLAMVNPFIQTRLADDFGKMVPAPDLVVGSGSKYALADPRRRTLLFLLVGRRDSWDRGDGGAVHVRLGGVTGRFNATWLDPRHGTTTAAGTVRGGAVRVFEPPSGDDWVLVLERR